MMAVFALTKNGAETAARILKSQKKAGQRQALVFLPSRYQAEYPESCALDKPLAEKLKTVWNQYSQFVFIMATGIVVRSVAPLLKNKAVDPAVVVLDEKGEFVISLLSGHQGGANQLARELAELMGAQPVITTATDVEGISALDELARRNNCFLEGAGYWQQVAASLLDSIPVGLFSTINTSVKFPSCVQTLDLDHLNTAKVQGMICLTEQIIPAQNLPRVILRPRNLVVGVGCRKDTDCQAIVRAVKETLSASSLSPFSIAHLATIERKKDEPGLVAAASELGVPLKWVSAKEIQAVEDRFPTSDFVKSKMGVGAVAEPAAWLTAVDPLLLAGKSKYPGITVAVVKDLGVVIK